MKIERLHIRDFKNLENVQADFAKAGSSIVLVGANGSGKSNLLEAIATIFRDLSIRRKTNFSYEISYSVKSHKVEIRNNPDDKLFIKIKAPGATRFSKISSKA